MKTKLTLAAIAATMTIPAAMPSAAIAQSYHHHHRYDDRAYRGNDGRYYQDCKKSSGTTGLIAGGVGGAVLGNVLGGGTLGTLAGAGGGALLGRHFDKKHDAAQNRRNGC